MTKSAGAPNNLLGPFPHKPGRGRSSDRKSTRLNSSHLGLSYAVFCLKKKILTSTSGTVTNLTTYGKKESGEPNHACNACMEYIWYTWTDVQNPPVILDTIWSRVHSTV